MVVYFHRNLGKYPEKWIKKKNGKITQKTGNGFWKLFQNRISCYDDLVLIGKTQAHVVTASESLKSISEVTK